MQLLRNWPVLVGGLALIAGVGFGTWLDAGYASVVFAAAAAVALGGGIAVATRQTALVGLATIVLLGIVGYGYALLRSTLSPSLVAERAVSDQRVTVVSAPEVEPTRSRAYVDTVLDGQPVRLRATWTSPTEAQYGDVVRVTGVVLPPEVDSEFNERGFLLAHHAVGTLRAAAFEPTGEQAGSQVLRALHTFRRWLLVRLDAALSAPQEAVVAGILLGEQSALPESIEADFRRTGTTHILVVSGSNVLVVAVIARLAFAVLGRRGSAVMAATVLLGFVVVTGADASVLRATALYLLVLLAELLGRRVHTATLLVAVALGLVLATPWALLYDISFQLSFAATFGLLVFGERFVGLIPAWLLPEYLAPTLAAELTTLPVLLYHFGTASMVAPLANLLVLPMVPAIMAGGSLSVIFPWLLPIAWATDGLVTVLLRVVAYLGQVPELALLAHHGLWALGSAVGVLLVYLAVRHRTSLEVDDDQR